MRDRHGDGHFGASRGNRKHHGLDIKVNAGGRVYSPINGIITREAIPYKDDPRFRGLLIVGTGEWEGYIVKMFYVEGILSGEVQAGSLIGYAQDLSARYNGITNHVHIEITKDGAMINPTEIWEACF